jgi:hypothetical protein
MEQKTKTTIGALRNGDRFQIKAKGEVWQIISRGSKYAVINIVSEAGHKMYAQDQLKGNAVKVLFIRHTIPQPGESCFIQDLQPGDVFKKTDDNFFEYVVQETGHQFYKVRRTDMAAYEMAGKLATVIFISKKEEVTK